MIIVVREAGCAGPSLVKASKLKEPCHVSFDILGLGQRRDHLSFRARIIILEKILASRGLQLTIHGRENMRWYTGGRGDMSQMERALSKRRKGMVENSEYHIYMAAHASIAVA